MNYLIFALLGLSIGSLFATMSQGLVLAYRGSGVINFAHGAMALLVAYVYAGLRSGRLLIPPLPNPLALVEGVAGWFGADLQLPSFPPFYHLSHPMGTVWAFLIAMVFAALLGYLAHLLVFNPLRNAPPLAKTVASVGLLLILQTVVVLRFGTNDVTVPPILPTTSVNVFGSAVPADRFFFLGIALVMMIALALMYRFTRLGIATRGASENERGAILLGLSPDRLAAVNWVLSGLSAGVAGVILSSLAGLNPTDLPLYVVPALGAALLARFESFGIATLLGVATGVVESVCTLLQSKYSWFPQGASSQAIPFLVIILGVVLRGRGLPERGSIIRVRLPASPEPKGVVKWSILLTIFTMLGLIFLPFDLRDGLLNSMVAVVLALSFVVVVGFAGQVSLMQMALAGIAALALTRFAHDLGLPFLLAALLSVIAAAVVGVLTGLPSLRVRGVQLAVLTLGGAYAFDNVVLSNSSLLRTADASDVPPPSLFGHAFSVNGGFPIGSKGSPSAWFGLFVLIIVLLCVWSVVWLRRSTLGRQFLAVRSNERAAASLGVGVARAKLIAFGIGAVLAGVVGVLSAYQFQGVSAVQYMSLASVAALVAAYLGGIGLISGAVTAGLLANDGLATRLLERLVHMGQYETLIAGVGLIMTVIFNPEGVASVVKNNVARVRHLVRPRLQAVRQGPREDVDGTSEEVRDGRNPQLV